MPRFLLFTLALLVVLPAQAQDDDAFSPRLSVEALGGASFFGRFLEQSVVTGQVGPLTYGERELRAPTSASFGGALTYQPFSNTAVRLGVTHAPTTLEFRDDTGTGATTLDTGDLGDLGVTVAALEVMRYLLEDGTVRPYAIVGVAAGLWTLDAPDGAIASGGEDTLVRFGGTTGAGLEARPSDRLHVRLEVQASGLGNPFSGQESFYPQPAVGDTIEAVDEPSVVRVLRLALGVGYSF